MRILLWHVHGSWTDAFVRGDHDYLLPTDQERSAWGLGRGGREWPNAREVAIDALSAEDFDLVIAQRPEELDEIRNRFGITPGVDVPTIFVEHNTPRATVPDSPHPLAGQQDVPIAHVTHFNALMWDCGDTPAAVIEHGINDPGPLYTGRLRRLAFVGNEPVRRRRVLGTDILEEVSSHVPVDAFGIGTEKLLDSQHVPSGLGKVDDSPITPYGDLPPQVLHPLVAERRAYLHPVRWTSLGLSLLEAMHMGMPVLALATTEAIRAVPPEAGMLTTEPRELIDMAVQLIDDPELAADMGRQARAHALAHYGLDRFLRDWDELLEAVVSRGPSAARSCAHRDPTRHIQTV
ncbi:glycosyltransferase [Brevibacterium renqingii]|uniref:glycosyltransferase n=1 Tax=Brevibacterium renqingii TaxID=2776916 RepID=UPI001ADF3E72|nr:glycosyltransferase [Brevibacterium renqingii]